MYDVFWRVVTELGDEKFYVVAVTFIYLAYSRRVGFKLASIFLLSMWSNVTLKYTLMMPRPPESVWKQAVHGPGFPSGHAQATSTFWYRLALEADRSRRAVMLIVASAFTALVSYSRVYLGVHYPLDVVGGAVLGATFAFLPELLRVKVGEDRLPLYAIASSIILLSVTVAFNVGASEGSLLILGSLAGVSTSYYMLWREGVREPKTIKGRLLLGLVGVVFAGILTVLYDSVSAYYPPLLDFPAYFGMSVVVFYLLPKTLGGVLG